MLMWLGGAALVAALLLLWMLRAGRRANRADWGNDLVNSLDGVSRIFCERFHRFTYEPIALPENGGAVVASNHLSGLDPLLLACASTKPLRYMIATEQYNRPWIRWMYKSMGAIPVDRNSAPEKAFYIARKALQAGEFIAVFPQGRITSPDEKVSLKRGVLLLAGLANAPIIPVRISGIAGVGEVITALLMRGHARLETGPPIRVNGPRDQRALDELQEFITGEPV
jgi:1-acyl-sn-glycerol-3-phosphate acyltransferase